MMMTWWWHPDNVLMTSITGHWPSPTDGLGEAPGGLPSLWAQASDASLCACSVQSQMVRPSRPSVCTQSLSSNASYLIIILPPTQTNKHLLLTSCYQVIILLVVTWLAWPQTLPLGLTQHAWGLATPQTPGPASIQSLRRSKFGLWAAVRWW